jgi:hypothetical protein
MRQIGGEIRKTRPAPMRDDSTNALLNRVQMVAISCQAGHLYPAEAFIPLAREWKAMATRPPTPAGNRWS